MRFGLLPFLVKNSRAFRFQRIASTFLLQSIILVFIIFDPAFIIRISPRPRKTHLQEFSCEVSTDKILGFQIIFKHLVKNRAAAFRDFRRSKVPMRRQFAFIGLAYQYPLLAFADSVFMGLLSIIDIRFPRITLLIEIQIRRDMVICQQDVPAIPVWSTYPQLCSTLHRYNAWSIFHGHRWSVLNRRQQAGRKD